MRSNSHTLKMTVNLTPSLRKYLFTYRDFNAGLEKKQRLQCYDTNIVKTVKCESKLEYGDQRDVQSVDVQSLGVQSVDVQRLNVIKIYNLLFLFLLVSFFTATVVSRLYVHTFLYRGIMLFLKFLQGLLPSKPFLYQSSNFVEAFLVSF